MKRAIFDLLRPLYWPLTTRLRKRFGSEYFQHPEMDLPPAYDAIQLDVERRLHRYLHCAPDGISTIAIVGANTATEIGRLRKLYRNAQFHCFEPSPKYLQALRAAWEGDAGVQIYPVAISNQTGKATFYELDMPGNGSLLAPDVEKWAQFNEWKNKETEEFTVDVRTLDESLQESLDLLWIDTQGNELQVLEGASATLARTKCIFLEMTLSPSPYSGGALYESIRSLLTKAGFQEVGMGIDPWNFTGTAFFLAADLIPDLVCKEHVGRFTNE